MNRKTLILILFLSVCIFSYAQKTLAPISTSQSVYGKDSVTVHAFDRFNDHYKYQTLYISNWLIETTDSFYIKGHGYGYQDSTLVFSDSTHSLFLVGTIADIDYTRASYILPLDFGHSPSYFSIKSYSELGQPYTQFCWLSNGEDSVTIGKYRFKTREEPAMYYAIINSSGDIQSGGLSQDFVRYNPTENTILEVIPLKYIAEDIAYAEDAVPLHASQNNRYITKELNNRTNDTLTLYNNTNTIQGAGPLDNISFQLNDSREVVATNNQSLLVSPIDSLSVIHLDTFDLAKNNSYTNIHFFRKYRRYIQNIDSLVVDHITVLAPLGSEINNEISDNTFIYWANGNTSVINSDTISHDSGVYIQVSLNYRGDYFYTLLKTPRKLELPISLTSGFFINDFIDSCNYAGKTVSFQQDGMQLFRSLQNSYDNLLYESCEVTTALDATWSAPGGRYSENDYLYELHNFTSNSSVTQEPFTWVDFEMKTRGNFKPYYLYYSIDLIGSTNSNLDHQISVYPNPTTGSINIEHKGANAVNYHSYTLFNIQGQEVQTGILLGNTIQLSNHILNGTYILTLTGESQRSSARIVVLK